MAPIIIFIFIIINIIIIIIMMMHLMQLQPTQVVHLILVTFYARQRTRVKLSYHLSASKCNFMVNS